MTGRDRRPEYLNARSIGAQTHKIYRGDCLGLGVLVVTAAAGLSICFDCSIHVRWVEKKPLGTARRLIVVSLSDRVESRANYRPRKQSLRLGRHSSVSSTEYASSRSCRPRPARTHSNPSMPQRGRFVIHHIRSTCYQPPPSWCPLHTNGSRSGWAKRRQYMVDSC